MPFAITLTDSLYTQIGPGLGQLTGQAQEALSGFRVMSNRLGPEDSASATAAALPALRPLDGIRYLAASAFPWRHLRLRRPAEDLGSRVPSARRLDLHRDPAAGLCGSLTDRVSDRVLRPPGPAARRHRRDRGRARDRRARAGGAGDALGGGGGSAGEPGFLPDGQLVRPALLPGLRQHLRRRLDHAGSPPRPGRAPAPPAALRPPP